MSPSAIRSSCMPSSFPAVTVAPSSDPLVLGPSQAAASASVTAASFDAIAPDIPVAIRSVVPGAWVAASYEDRGACHHLRPRRQPLAAHLLSWVA